MLEIVGDRYASCDGVGRRNFLRVGALGLGGLALPGLLRSRALGATAGPGPRTCRAVIQVILSGGPSAMETLDPKPEAPTSCRTDLRAIATRLPGVGLGELMPALARVLDRAAIVRSLTHESADHVAGLHRIATGFASTLQRPGLAERPSVGSVVARLGAPGRSGVPPYVAMTDGALNGGLFLGGAYLGPGENPLALGDDPSGAARVRNLGPPPGLTPVRVADRRALLARLDDIDRRRDRSGSMAALDRFEAQAYDMVTGPSVREALDLGREDPKLRDRYGPTRIGRACLLARRLVEAGVGFVTIAEGDWDHHSNVAEHCRAQLPPVDVALAALVEDLHARGLADDVLLLAWGEFGRTPRVNGSGGRDHWPGSMSALLAGGGLKMGQVVGSTDRQGGRPVDRPVRPEDVIATVYHALGIDPRRTFPDETGRPMAVLDAARPIAELI